MLSNAAKPKDAPVKSSPAPDAGAKDSALSADKNGGATSPLLHSSLSVSFYRAFERVSGGTATKRGLVEALGRRGFTYRDPRLSSLFDKLHEYGAGDILTPQAFADATEGNAPLIDKILNGDLVVPDFERFADKVGEIYARTRNVRLGRPASYIPQLERANPEHYAVSICTTDGQRFSVGDAGVPFTAQSLCMAINYCLALELNGEENVHNHMGREPGGFGDDDAFTARRLPRNPFTVAGGIMACSLVKPHDSLAQRFEYVIDVYADLAAGWRPGFNNSVYRSEKECADRHFAAAHAMRAAGVFPPRTDIGDAVDFYLQSCSVELNADALSVIAASLANGGSCPFTGARAFSPETTRRCLSLMHSCGLYGYSSEFAYAVGLPAKSGASGAVMLIVPGVMGAALWSPPLDECGNSARAVAFCKDFSHEFRLHHCESSKNALLRGSGNDAANILAEESTTARKVHTA
ncbi:MAG: glutaminase [Rickettsiales bacterium]